MTQHATVKAQPKTERKPHTVRPMAPPSVPPVTRLSVPSRPLRAIYEADQRLLLARVEREIASLDNEIEAARIMMETVIADAKAEFTDKMEAARNKVVRITADAEAEFSERVETLNAIKIDRMAVDAGIRIALVSLDETSQQAPEEEEQCDESMSPNNVVEMRQLGHGAVASE